MRRHLIGVILSITALSSGVFSFQPLASSPQRSNTSMPLKTFVSDLSNRSGLTLGFIGCGTIASAIVKGLLTQTEIQISAVYISRRSHFKSSALAQKYGDRIVICDDNQKIAEACDTLFLCVLPEMEEEILSHLTIRNDKILVSLVVRFVMSNCLGWLWMFLTPLFFMCTCLHVYLLVLQTEISLQVN